RSTTAGASGAGIHGTCAHHLAGTRSSRAHAAISLARLFARRLVEELGHLRATRRCRAVGAKRRGNAGPAPRRTDSRNAGAGRGATEGSLVEAGFKPALARQTAL